MINDTIDFDYAISKIVHGTETNIFLQPEILKSDYINESFKQIENTLNTLYEKTRYLEDSIAYTKQFLETRISYFNNEISAILHEIENVADSAKNLSYISYNVPFVENKKSIFDRNGLTNIQPLVIRDDKLTLDYITNKTQPFSLWSRISDSIPYNDNMPNIKDEPYRVIYLEEKVIPDGLTETIYVYFDEPTIINGLSIKLSNCFIRNMKFGLINGTEEFIGDYTVDMSIDTRVCTYIKFDLVCINYDLNVYTLDKNLMTDNIWSKIQEFEYNQITNIETKFDASVVLSKTVTNAATGTKKTITYNSPTYTGTEDAIALIGYQDITIDQVTGKAVITSIDFDAPKTGDKKKTSDLKMYSYVFGIDSFEIKNTEYYTDGYMISDPIVIGTLKEDEYIRLEVKHEKQECAEISYSIMDGDREIPIAIMKDDYIENELIFENVDTRFTMDFDASISYEPEIIKLDGAVITSNYLDAKDKVVNQPGRYSVTYKPSADCYDYKPLNNTIQVKCYIRTYGTVRKIPYISSITVKKYGEESLWINRF